MTLKEYAKGTTSEPVRIVTGTKYRTADGRYIVADMGDQQQRMINVDHGSRWSDKPVPQYEHELIEYYTLSWEPKPLIFREKDADTLVRVQPLETVAAKPLPFGTVLTCPNTGAKYMLAINRGNGQTGYMRMNKANHGTTGEFYYFDIKQLGDGLNPCDTELMYTLHSHSITLP